VLYGMSMFEGGAAAICGVRQILLWLLAVCSRLEKNGEMKCLNQTM
jgi:hypothetical protein